MADDVTITLVGKDKTQTGFDSAIKNMGRVKEAASSASNELSKGFEESANRVAERFIGLREMISLVKETFREYSEDVSAYNGDVANSFGIVSGAAATLTNWMVGLDKYNFLKNTPVLGSIISAYTPDEDLHKAQRNQLIKGFSDDQQQEDHLADAKAGTNISDNEFITAQRNIARSKEDDKQATIDAFDAQGGGLPSEAIASNLKEQHAENKKIRDDSQKIVDLYVKQLEAAEKVKKTVEEKRKSINEAADRRDKARAEGAALTAKGVSPDDVLANATSELEKQEKLLANMKRNRADTLTIVNKETEVQKLQNKVTAAKNELEKEGARRTAEAEKQSEEAAKTRANHDEEAAKRREEWALDDKQSAAEKELREAQSALRGMDSVKNEGGFHIVHVRQQQQEMNRAVSHLAQIEATLKEIKDQKRELTLR